MAKRKTKKHTKKRRKTPRCSKCSRVGHNKLSCGKKSKRKSTKAKKPSLPKGFRYLPGESGWID